MGTNVDIINSELKNVQVSEKIDDSAKHKIDSQCRANFLFLQELGEGSYSTVHLCSQRNTSKKFAIKVCSKHQITREKKVQQIFREKEILKFLSTEEKSHPLIVKLYCTFQDTENLYFVLTLATGKDLLIKLKTLKTFTHSQAKFIAGEILIALDHIHKLNIVHRDVKPENILFRENGHILLSDFGCAKQIDLNKNEELTNETTQTSEKKKRRASFVGTALYVLNGQESLPPCDYWAWALILYEMLCGKRAFTDESEYLVFQRILKLRYSFEQDNFPEAEQDAKDLITKILVIDPTKRLNFEQISSHKFFDSTQYLQNLIDSESPFTNV